MPKIETLDLRVRDPNTQVKFYCDVLGMKDIGDGCVSYADQETALRFLKTERSYTPHPHDLYWKIALAVPDIELACRQLQDRGVSVGTPSQFRDVGYLTKIVDPEGLVIELIDHWFQGNRPDGPVNPDFLGGGAHLNLLTLRTADIDPIKRACAEWGMTPLSVQPVTPYGYTLYFFAFTAETPPSTDLMAVENREWVYQRPYTVLEVQHLHSIDAVGLPDPGKAGYAGMTVSGVPGLEHNAGGIMVSSGN
ncbi:VOC family protein [Parasedimentitalea marina]|uniref:VOC family protein n=1 Tax=Parasedimentitalea marina TaxID=2483033 RepID=A0A3T0N218_9RHOB|nr:VOC family protein [Parasedimentitalea marina]AZV78039.1 VOC family protein [Parasedimentitalea marina]